MHVDQIGAALADDAFGNVDLLVGDRDARLQRLHFGARRIELGLADHLLLHELFAAAERQLRFAEPRLVLCRAAARRLELRLPDGKRCPNLRVIQLGEHLALLNGPAFFDKHFEDLAGDL